ncbi:MAG TPA: MFS transporter [Rhizomicrobium sp.]|nr:MFS transporter [Rhizomicrobium sp.]
MSAIDVADIIDQQKISAFQARIVVMAWFTLFLDGIDNQAIAYVAPALSASWHLPRGALGPVFAAGVVGVALGALIIGPLADRYGRKRVLVSTVLYFAAMSLAITQARDLTQLLVLRFLIGLGLGAVVPLAVVLVNEFAPRRRRAAMVTLTTCGYAMGAASGGLLAAQLVPIFGWTSMFYVGCAIPVLLALALVAWVPESIRLLTLRGDGEAIRGILRKINPVLALPADAQFTLRQEGAEAHAGSWRVVRLFKEGRSATTLLIWFCFFMNLLVLNVLNNWLPTLVTHTGIPQEQAVRAATALQFGGMTGVIAMGFLADRFGFFKVLPFSFGVGAVFIALIGVAGADLVMLVAMIFVAGFCNIGSQMTLAALTATQYPTDIRSTGVRWAHGVARLLSIAGLLLAGVLLSMNWPLAGLYDLVAVPMVCGSVAVLVLAGVRRARQPATALASSVS